MLKVLKVMPGFVFNKKTMVMIDRKTPWGNPYIIGLDGDRNDVVIKHTNWLRKWVAYKEEEVHRIGIRIYSNKWVIENIEQLKGKCPVCWCVPESCHGDILLMLANIGY